MNLALFNRYTTFIGIAVLIVVADQLTKQIAYGMLNGQPPVEVLPILSWVMVFNRGAAFGFMDQAGGWQHYLFAGLAIVVSVFITFWLRQIYRQNKLLAWGLTLILGGAIGNLIDRLLYQHVIDFILLHYQNWYFPAFNIADMSITFGAILLIMDSLGLGQKLANRSTPMSGQE